jgi:LmbE family N-acetylglucosaminyl deacetylase
MTLAQGPLICLSPHLDDAVLSCGATIRAHTARGGRALVATLCAASPTDASPTDYAEELRTRWGGAQDPVQVRRNEDRDAVALLGAEALNLDFMDCVYRVDGRTGEVMYPTERSIFGDVQPAEAGLAAEMRVALDGAGVLAPGGCILAPLAVGHHVDHLIVRQVAERLAAAGYRVLYYEDFPYAGDSQAVATALAQCAGQDWRQVLECVTADELAAKCEAIACYRSQLSTFWADDAAMRAFVHRQAQTHHGELVERYWEAASPCVADRWREGHGDVRG